MTRTDTTINSTLPASTPITASRLDRYQREARKERIGRKNKGRPSLHFKHCIFASASFHDITSSRTKASTTHSFTNCLPCLSTNTLGHVSLAPSTYLYYFDYYAHTLASLIQTPRRFGSFTQFKSFQSRTLQYIHIRSIHFIFRL